MQISTAYFAGVGTVIVAVAAGLGGGYFAANMASTPPAVSKLERRMSAEPISVAAATVQPVARPVEMSTPVASPQEQPQSQASVSSDKPIATTNIVVAEEKPANNAAVAQPAQAAPLPTRSAEQKPVEQGSEQLAAPRDAYAKVRDGDVKRADAEKRRAERRQAWAERRHVQQPREQELDAVEEQVREVTEPRRIRIREESGSREMFAEPAERDAPRIRLFGQDD